MSKRLELDIQKVGNYGLMIKIIFQASSLNEKGLVLSNGKNHVRIYNRPELTEDTLYLRGIDNKSDKSSVTCFYQTRKQRDQMYDFVSTCEKILNNQVQESLIMHPTLKITKGDCFYSGGLFIQYVDDSAQVINLCPVVAKVSKISRKNLSLLPAVGDSIPEKTWEYAGNVLLDNQKAA